MKESNGALGGMGIIWNTRTTNIKIIVSNSNWMRSVVSSNKHNHQFILIYIYGPILASTKWKVWDDISAFMELYPETTMIMDGDFNAILDLKKNLEVLRF